MNLIRWLALFFNLCLLSIVSTQVADSELRCPENWVRFSNSCYRFIKSPIRRRFEAVKNCQAYNAELASPNNQDEHKFLINELSWRDPQRRPWYTRGRQNGINVWNNEGDSTPQSLDLSSLIHPELYREDNINIIRDYLAYNFSNGKWGFDKVTGDDAFAYICEAEFIRIAEAVPEKRTFTYGVNIDDPEKVPRGPYFVKQPQNVVYNLHRRELKDVVMTCLAKGYPTPTYEWLKEELEEDKLTFKKIDPFKDARYTLSGGSLIISGPRQDEDRGNYFCKATNIFGSIISETIQLNFGFIGDFNLKRSPESGNQNWGKAMACDPPGYFPRVTYYWSRPRFPDLVEENARVFMSFDGTLYFSALEQIDQASYSCNVIGDDKEINMGKNGPIFPLTVTPYANPQQLQFANNFPKVFPEAPVAGKEVRLECVAFGYPVPSYNWTRKGSALPKESYLTNFNRVLIIPSVRMEDQGEYVCNINNYSGLKQASITLNIQAEPNFTIPLIDQFADYNSDLTWTCEAFGVPDVTYQWLKNGELLQMQNLDATKYNVQDNILTIKNLDPEKDNGMYQCRAQNTLKTRYSSAQLKVLKMPPSFKKRPLDPEIYAGESYKVTIFCNPEAAPRPKFEWEKDEFRIGSGGPKIIVNGNLTIFPVSRGDAGIYTCIAKNDYGADKSSTRLTVLRLPTFVEALPAKINTIVGQNLELRCYANSEDKLDVAYVWYHNGIKLHTTQNTYSFLIVSGGSLSIYNMSFANAGNYQCIVKTVVGSISTTTELHVEGPPGPPGGVIVSQIVKKTVTLQWTDGSSNGKPIMYYIISACTKDSNRWVNVSQTSNVRPVSLYADRKEVILEDIVIPWQTYIFRMYAVNDLGVSSPSESSPERSVPADKPYVYPQNVSGGGGKVGDLTITWKPLAPEDRNGPGVYYKVFWKRRGFDKEFQSMDIRNVTKEGIATINISPDYYYTEYDVKVQAANDQGFGPESPVVTIFSAEGIPTDPVSSVIASPFNSTAINVTWSSIPPARDRIKGKLIGHRLKYWINGASEDSATYYLNRNLNSWALVVGLQPNTYYYFKVMVYNAAGAGPESEKILERTYRKAPQNPPTSVFVKGVNPSTIKVVWRYVSTNSDEEPVIGFKVRVWPLEEDLSRATDTIVPLGHVLEAWVDGLSPGKRYSARVLAYSEGGDGRMSSPAARFQMGDERAFLNSVNKCEYSLAFILLINIIVKFL